MTFRVPRIALIFLVSLFLATTGVRNALGEADADAAASSEIMIVSPTDGATFAAPATILVRVEGHDIPNVGHLLELYKGNERVDALVLDPLIPIRTTPVFFSFTFTLDHLPAGNYVLTAAIDGSPSAPVHIIVRKRRHHGKR
jgi:hypothetical protein